MKKRVTFGGLRRIVKTLNIIGLRFQNATGRTKEQDARMRVCDHVKLRAKTREQKRGSLSTSKFPQLSTINLVPGSLQF